jgi:hypothetical protein
MANVEVSYAQKRWCLYCQHEVDTHFLVHRKDELHLKMVRIWQDEMERTPHMVNFGKYRGESFEKVMQMDPDYVQAVLDVFNTRQATPFVQYAMMKRGDYGERGILCAVEVPKAIPPPPPPLAARLSASGFQIVGDDADGSGLATSTASAGALMMKEDGSDIAAGSEEEASSPRDEAAGVSAEPDAHKRARLQEMLPWYWYVRNMNADGLEIEMLLRDIDELPVYPEGYRFMKMHIAIICHEVMHHRLTKADLVEFTAITFQYTMEKWLKEPNRHQKAN